MLTACPSHTHTQTYTHTRTHRQQTHKRQAPSSQYFSSELDRPVVCVSSTPANVGSNTTKQRRLQSGKVSPADTAFSEASATGSQTAKRTTVSSPVRETSRTPNKTDTQHDFRRRTADLLMVHTETHNSVCNRLRRHTQWIRFCPSAG